MVRSIAATARNVRTAAGRQEMPADALTAAVASAAVVTAVTEDRDFELLMQLDPSLRVIFCSRS